VWLGIARASRFGCQLVSRFSCEDLSNYLALAASGVRASVVDQLMVVGLEALAAGESPPDTVTVFVTLAGAVAETFTVTVIAG